MAGKKEFQITGYRIAMVPFIGSKDQQNVITDSNIKYPLHYHS